MMAIPELDPREHGMANANADISMTGAVQHSNGTLAQQIQSESSVPVSVQSILEEQSEEAMYWCISGPYAPKQAARSLRILMVATEAPPVRGGIARTVGYLRDGFQKRGHYVDVLAYPEVGRLVFGEVRLSSLIFKLPKLLRHINEYDVIDIHGATPTISDVALLLAHLRGAYPIVIYTHHMEMNFSWGGFLNRAYNYLHHRLSTRADTVVAETRDSLRLLGDNCPGIVIPPGIDLSYFSTNGPKDPRFTVLFIGQFRSYKGVRVLLHAMSQVTGARLLLAGQGPEEQTYRTLGAKLSLDVEFHIGVNDDQLRQLYQRAHAIVLPSVSHAEAFGLALVEGMAAGCVPIASALRGVREVVGQTGFLFPVGDANHLARILCSLRDDPVQVQQISDRARVRATAFGRENTVYGYERLIAELIICRDLKRRLTDQTQTWASALHAFVTEVTHILEAEWTEIVLYSIQDELYSVHAMKQSGLVDHLQLQRVSSLLARYAVNTGNSTLIGLNDGPLHLRDVFIYAMPAAMVTPLTIDGAHFGALLLMRKRPFDQHDLSSLKHFARHIAPMLHVLIKRGVVEANL